MIILPLARGGRSALRCLTDPGTNHSLRRPPPTPSPAPPRPPIAQKSKNNSDPAIQTTATPAANPRHLSQAPSSPSRPRPGLRPHLRTSPRLAPYPTRHAQLIRIARHCNRPNSASANKTAARLRYRPSLSIPLPIKNPQGFQPFSKDFKAFQRSSNQQC